MVFLIVHDGFLYVPDCVLDVLMVLDCVLDVPDVFLMVPESVLDGFLDIPGDSLWCP